jgi:hypothetical protein
VVCGRVVMWTVNLFLFMSLCWFVNCWFVNWISAGSLPCSCSLRLHILVWFNISLYCRFDLMIKFIGKYCWFHVVAFGCCGLYPD